MDDYWEKAPYRKEYFAFVGLLCNQWAAVERLYAHLASDIMGASRKRHDILFRHFGFAGLSMFLQEYAAATVRRKEFREHIAHVTKYVDVCRRNRNLIVHGFNAEINERSVATVRIYPDQRRAKTKTFRVSAKDVQRVCDNCEVAGRLIIQCQFLVSKRGVSGARRMFGDRWRARLLSKPALPRYLGENRRKPRKQKHPPRSSGASRRKAADARKKDGT
jgi:hypothetical protein